MMSPKVIQQFVTTALPSESTCYQLLEFWNHGMGPFGFGQSKGKSADDSASLTLKDMSNVLAATVEARNGRTFDILGFDACLMMSYEVASELSPYADYLLASEETEPGHGWDYSAYNVLSKQGEVKTPIELSSDIIDGYMHHMSRSPQYPLTLAIISLQQFRVFAEVFNHLTKVFSKELYRGDKDVFAMIARARENSVTFGSYFDPIQEHNMTLSHMDLGGFLDALSKDDSTLDDSAVLYNYIGRTAGKAKALYDACFLINRMASGNQSAGYTGMSIFFPEKGPLQVDRTVASRKLYYYKQYLGTGNPDWQTMLRAFHEFKPVKNGVWQRKTSALSLNGKQSAPSSVLTQTTVTESVAIITGGMRFAGAVAADAQKMKFYVLAPNKVLLGPEIPDVYVMERPGITNFVQNNGVPTTPCAIGERMSRHYVTIGVTRLARSCSWRKRAHRIRGSCKFPSRSSMDQIARPSRSTAVCKGI
jgi:hypothetical protein